MGEIWASMVESPLESLLYAMAILACFYTLVAIFCLRRFARSGADKAAFFLSSRPSSHAVGVTVLKPLYGAEPGLYDNLASFCRQDYAGPVQVLFGVGDADDPAAAVARQVVTALRAGGIEGAPAGITAEVVIDSSRHGANGKVSNLINLTRHIHHDTVVLADSDICVAPDYLRRLTAALDRPGVGVVTCLYRGLPRAGLWSNLGAMGVDYAFLPNAVTGVVLKLAQPCVGATIAMRRSTLDAVGGFAAIKNRLADDYELGAAVRKLGLKVILADFAVGHAHGEKTFLDLWRQDLRWARTIRSLEPFGYLGTAVTFPLAWALLALVVGGFDPAGVILVFAALLCRMTLRDEVNQRFAGRSHALWLSPLRDLLGFAVYLASFVPGRVHWRGQEFTLIEDGAMESREAEETEAGAA
jgi:ceramide glucosyltransferase